MHPIKDVLAAKASSHELQRTLYAQMNDVDDVVTLLSNPNLAPDLDATIADRSESAILAAWLRRPGRTSEDYLTMLERNKTAQLRIEVAAAADLPAEVYTSLLDKPTFAVAATLYRNAAAPAVARDAAARLYATLHPANQLPAPGLRLTPVFGDSLAAWALPLLRATDRPALVRALMELVEFAAVDIEDVIVRVLVPTLIAGNRTANSAVQDAVIAILWQQPLPTQQQRLGFVALLKQDVPAPVLARSDWLQALEISVARSCVRHRSTRIRPLDVDGAGATTSLEGRAATATDPAALQDVLDEVARTGDAAAAAALIRNRHSTARQVADAIQYAEKRHLREFAAVRIDDIEVAAVLLAGCGPFAWNDLLAQASNPQQLLVRTLGLYRDPNGRPVRAPIDDAFVTREALELLGVDFVIAQPGTRAAEIFGDMVTEALSTPEAWQVFDSLLPDFTGTTRDLLTACAGVAAA